MRGFIAFLAVVAILGLFVGYERGWFQLTSSSNEDRTRFEVQVDKDQWRKDRDAFVNQAQKRLDDMDRQLNDLKSREARADGATRTRIQQAIHDLNQKQQAAREELRELGRSAQDGWAAAKTKLGQALDDLKNGIDRAASRFQ